MHGGEQYGLLSGIHTITESLSASLDTVLTSTGWSLTDTEARDAVETLWRAKAQLEAAYLHTLRVLDARPDALDGAGNGKVAATFLIGRLHVDSNVAAADVKAARALDPDDGPLAQLGAALAAGQVSRAHVDVAVTAIGKLPKAVLAQHFDTGDDTATSSGDDARNAGVNGDDTGGDAAGPDGAGSDGAGDVGAGGVGADGSDADRDGTGEADNDGTRGDNGAEGDGDVRDGSGRARTMSGAQFVDGWLAEHARRVQPRMLKAMARGLRDRLDPDHEDRSFDPDGFAKRSVYLHVDRFTGMATLRATLLAADAAQLAAFLRSASKPAPPAETLREEPDGNLTPVEVRDERGVDMRRYDALFSLLRSAFAGRFTATATATVANANANANATATSGPGDDTDAPQTSAPATATDAGVEAGVEREDQATGVERGSGSAVGSGASVPVQLLVTATLDQVAAAAALNAGSPVPAVFAAAGRAHLDRVGDLDPSLLAYLSCTATVQRLLLDPHGRPLDLGRSNRFATLSQRRATAVRDGGCVIPYCPCPAEDVDLHHLLHWALGGPTDLVNLASVCGRHHQESHAGIWAIEVRDGIVWVKPPPWIDPQQRWLRAPRRTREEAVQRAAEQLRLRLDDAA